MRLLGSGPRQATKTFRIQERALPPSGPLRAILATLLRYAAMLQVLPLSRFRERPPRRLRPLFSAPGNLAPFGHAGARSTRNLTGLGGTGSEPLTSLAHEGGSRGVCWW